MFDILAVGDVLSDIFIQPEELFLFCPFRQKRPCPEPVLCLTYGEKINIKEVHFEIGGSAANLAVGLSRLGLKVALSGAIGRDLWGEEIERRLKKEKVSLKLLKMKDIKTGFSIILNFKGERTILVYHSLSDYSQLFLPSNLKIPWLYLGPLGLGFEKLYLKATSLGSTKNVHLALNPGLIQIRERKALEGVLRVTTVLFLNKEEAEELAALPKKAEIKDLLSLLKKLGPEIVIITDGGEGAFAFDGKEYLHISPYQAKKLETTGAGDAFSSGVIGGLIKKGDLKEGLRWGVINSASVIEKIGAQPGLLSQAQIEKRLKKAPWPRILR